MKIWEKKAFEWNKRQLCSIWYHTVSDINILICRESREITGSDSGAIGSKLKFGSDLPSDNTFESDS